MGELQDRELVAMTAYDLQADRQTFRRESARHGN